MFDFIPPSSPQEALSRARKLAAQGKIEKAKKTLEKGLKGTQEDFDLLLEIGKFEFKEGGMKEAASRFKQAYSLLPREKDRWIDFVETQHYEGGQPLETAELLLEVYTESEEFDHVDKLLKNISREDLEVITKRNEGKLSAIYSHKSPSELSPRDISLHYLLSYLYSEKGEEKRMKEVFEKILSASPKEGEKILKFYQRMAVSRYHDPLPYLSIGEIRLERNEIEEAVTAYRKALEMDETRIGEILKRAEDYRLKLKDEALKPAHHPLLHLLSQLYILQKDFDRALDLLHILRNEGKDLGEVVKVLREILRQKPDHPRALFELGETYLKEGRKEHAVEQFARTLELKPDRGEEVIQRYRKVFEMDPGNLTTLIHLANYSIQRKEWEESVSLLNQGFKANPGLIEEILPRLQTILEILHAQNYEDPTLKTEFHPSYIQGLSLFGKCFVEKGRMKDALLVYDHLLALGNPQGVEEARMGLENVNHPRAPLLLGIAHLARGEREEGVTLLTKFGRESPPLIPETFYELVQLVERDSGQSEDVLMVCEGLQDKVDPFLLQFVRGEVFHLQGKGESALEAYRKCLEIDPTKRKEVNLALRKILRKEPNLLKGYLLLGDSHLEMGEIEEAVSYFERLLALDPSGFENILKRYRKVLQQDPKNLQIHKILVEGQYRRGMYARVREECETRIGLFPKEGLFYLRLGESLSQLGQLRESIPYLLRAVQLDKNHISQVIEDFKRILSIDPSLLDARFGLGNLSILQGQYEEATRQFREIALQSPERREKAYQGLKKVIEESPTFGDSYFALGELYLQEGEVGEGLSYFQKACEVSPFLVDPILQVLKKREEAESFLLQGRCHLLKGLFPLASENFLKAFSKKKELRQEVIHGLFQITQRDPDDLTSQYALSRIYRNEGKVAEVCEILSQIARREGEVERVRGELREILSLEPSNGKAHFLLGNLSLRKGDIPGAVQSFESTLASPGTAPLLDQVIFALRKAAETQNPLAIHSLSKALVQKGEIEEAVGWIGKLVEMENGWMDTGIQSLKEILAQTHSPKGSLLLGKLFLKRGDVNKAEEIFTAGLRSSNPPELQIDLILYLSRSLEITGRKEHAEERFRSALKIGLDRREVYHRLSQIGKWENEVEIRKIDEQLRSAEGGIQNSEFRTPHSQSLLLRKIQLLREMGDVEKAMKELNEFGIRCAPESGEFRTPYLKELALCHLQKGNLLTASEILRGISFGDPPLSPIEIEILDLEAKCFEKMGEWIIALSCLNRISQEDETYPGVIQRIERITNALTLERMEDRPRVLLGHSSIL